MIVFAGLDRLSGFAIDSARLLLPKEEDGTNIVGSANLPNHSVFTFALVGQTPHLFQCIMLSLSRAM